jgi:hypothetical protein
MVLVQKPPTTLAYDTSGDAECPLRQVGSKYQLYLVSRHIIHSSPPLPMSGQVLAQHVGQEPVEGE